MVRTASVLDKLNAASKRKTINCFNILPPGEYIVQSFSKYETEQGTRLRIELCEYCTFLPGICIFSDDEIAALNNAIVWMCYGGKDTENRLILNFYGIEHFIRHLRL